MDSTDFYEILGLNKNATTEEIKNAYKKLAKEWHPDKNPDPLAKEKFQNIQIAYTKLSNKQSRLRYDTFDSTSNPNKLKEFYLYFCIGCQQIFEKYDISEEDKQEFDAMFNVHEFESELESGNVNQLYDKICLRLWNFVPKVVMKKLSKQNQLMGILFNGLPDVWMD